MSNIWFTSDLHFNHENILSFSNKTRPWHTVKEMNEALITSWNSVVKHEDTVYVLGDFILGRPDEDVMAEIVTSLNGWIHLIPGNHDTSNKLEIYKRVTLLTVEESLFKLRKPRDIVMCHFPLAIWHHDYQGTWHLHGHCHGSFPKDNYRRMDVGVDTHPEHRPYHIDEISEIMSTRDKKGHQHVP